MALPPHLVAPRTFVLPAPLICQCIEMPQFCTKKASDTLGSNDKGDLVNVVSATLQLLGRIRRDFLKER